ncbi:MAG: aldo/keto reductase [Anaerolineae bacterium]|nr:aldo/keto reductase [Anaerolineae bacterium]
MYTVRTVNGIPYRLLGSTGEEVSIIGVGGFHIGRYRDRELGVRIVRTALNEGVNFLDNAWCYNDGLSEEIMGLALLGGYRDQAFLMTKNHGRDAPTFRAQLEQSLRRLQTDRIDLLQLHEIIDDGVPQRILSQGVVEAALEAKKQGKIRYVGFTGHRWPRLLEEMLEGSDIWDAVQLPVNLLDHHYRSFARSLIPRLSEAGIGIIGMKSLAGGNLLRAGVSVREAISYSLSQAVSTLVCGMDSLDVLEQNLAIVRDWHPLSAEEQSRLLDRVALAAETGHLEHYKTG